MEPVLDMQSMGLPNPRSERTVQMLWRLTVALAVIPMVIAFSITILYAITGWEWCIGAGIWWLLIGGGLVVTGLCLFTVCIGYEWRQRRREFRWRRFTIVGVLLSMNIAAAILCIFVGSALAERLSVVVVNKSGAPIDSCVIDGFGFHTVHTSIAQGDTILDTFHPHGGSELEVVITQGTRVQHIKLGHDTDDTSWCVEIGPDGRSNVEHNVTD